MTVPISVHVGSGHDLYYQPGARFDRLAVAEVEGGTHGKSWMMEIG